MKIIFLFTAFMLLNFTSFSQVTVENKIELTGDLKTDARLLAGSYSPEMINEINLNPEHKSVWLATILSAAIPGAGQAYNGDFWKTAIFVGLEAGLITAAILYNNKGDDKTKEFEAYADENWSVVKYANWLIANRTALGLPDGNVTIDPNTSLKPWERVNWTELNHVESRFSHKLPRYGEQQYYELIGKYPQYNHGWRDQLNDNSPEYNANLTPMFLGYSQMRGEANDFYNASSRFIVFVVINHILSAGEAAWSSAVFNKNLSMNLRLSPEIINTAMDVEFIPKLNVSLRF
ncbi:MAG: hypothetical protein J0L60_09725 [Ignavibacteria bacterium]|nr:hypothetical protein [Ignavibacteria bacterium]